MKIPRDLKQSPSSVNVGEGWLYWNQSRNSWQEVEIASAANGRPQRIRVQHLDADAGGRSEWVPSKRLHVPLSLRDEYLASVAAYDRLAAEAPITAVSDVALLTLSGCVPTTTADMDDTGDDGVLRVSDISALATATGIGPDTISDHPHAIADGSTWFLPWPVVERLIIALLRRNPEPGMQLLDELMRRRQEYNLRLETNGEPWWKNDDQTEGWALRLGQWHDAETRQIQALRSWLDNDHPTLAESYLELKQLHAEMVDTINEAIPRIRRVRSKISERLAERMEDLVRRPPPLLDVRGPLTDRDIEQRMDGWC